MPHDDVAEFLSANAERIAALADLVVPAHAWPDDDYPSASEAGAVRFVARILAERTDWLDRVGVLVDADDPTTARDWEWFAQLVSGGYYADEANGGNADESPGG